ncbi:MAG: hypothetical protein DWH81_15050 [Planctomycetota bacterium]|nr:MAG: hypothetical protein DWH81_15050 [Planctomycetota bacterium]
MTLPYHCRRHKCCGEDKGPVTVYHLRGLLKGIWFILTIGCHWQDIPREYSFCGDIR